MEWFASFVRLPWATISKTLQVEECFQRECQGKTLSGKETKRFSSFLQNLSRAYSLCVSDEVFWTKDLIEETKKGLQDSYTINSNRYWKRHVCPIEQFSTQSCTKFPFHETIFCFAEMKFRFKKAKLRFNGMKFHPARHKISSCHKILFRFITLFAKFCLLFCLKRNFAIWSSKFTKIHWFRQISSSLLLHSTVISPWPAVHVPHIQSWPVSGNISRTTWLLIYL